LKKIPLFIFLVSVIFNLYAQEKDSLSLSQKVYHLNYWVDIPLTAVAAVTASLGAVAVDNKSPLDSLTIIGLDANDINRFDRSATWQDADFAPTARRISDVTLAVSNMLPLLLLVDKKIRQDWGDLLLLYLETQAITGNLYFWGCVVHVDRIRPLVYNQDVPWEEKTGELPGL